MKLPSSLNFSLIRQQIVLIIIVGFFVPISLIIASSLYYVNYNMKNQINSIHSKNLAFAMHQIEGKFNTIDQFLQQFITNPLLCKLFAEADFSEINSLYLESVSRFESSVTSFSIMDEGINIGFISSERGRYLLKGNFDPAWEEIADNLLNYRRTSTKSIEVLPNPNVLGNDQKVISYSQKINGLQNYSESDKVILTFFLEPVFLKSVFNNDMRSLYYIFFDSELIIKNSETDFAIKADELLSMERFTVIESGPEKMILLKSHSEFFPLTIVQLLPQSDYYNDLRKMKIFFFSLLCFSIGMIFITHRLLRIRISKPAEDIAQAFESVCARDYNVKIDSRYNNEFGIIARDFNKMMNSLRRYIQRLKEKEKQRRMALLRSFQMQINPHFINNTLLAARAIAERRQESEVAQILGVLGRLINSTLMETGSLVPVGRELEKIESYLFIMNTRHNHSLNIKIDIDLDCLELMIPQLILQPIIENSIEHGLQKKLINGKKDAILKIKGKIVNDMVVFEVRDNGVGMSEKDIKTIMSKNQQQSTKSSYHIGLNNIQKRILYKSGKRYGIDIQSNINEFTCVSVKLPLLRKVN